LISIKDGTKADNIQSTIKCYYLAQHHKRT